MSNAFNEHAIQVAHGPGLSPMQPPPPRSLRHLSCLLSLVALFSSFSLLQAADLSATKEVVGNFRAGEVIVYTIIISNSGRSAQEDNRGDEMTDPISDDLEIMSVNSDSGNVKFEGQNVSWNGRIASNGSVQIQIHASIRSSVPAGRRISNQAVIRFDRDGNRTNDSETLSDSPDLPGEQDPTSFVVQEPPPPPDPAPSPGADLTVTIDVSPKVPAATLLIHHFEVGLQVCNEGQGTQADNPGPELVLVFPPDLQPGAVTGILGVDIPDNDCVAPINLPPLDPTGCLNFQVEVEAVGTTWAARYLNGAPFDQAVPIHAIVHYDGDGDGINEATRTFDPGLAFLKNNTFLFPHVFSLGENSTTISVIGIDQEGDFSVELYDQGGIRVGDSFGSLTLPGLDLDLSEVVDGDFVGSALVRCERDCHVEAVWEFNLPGGRSRVGIAPFQDVSFGESVWSDTSHGAAVGEFPNPALLPGHIATVPGRGFAMAVRAARWPASCSVEYVDGNGDVVAEETITLPPFGQQAAFPKLPESFVKGEVVFNCNAPVAALTVVQDPVNGFPTVGSVTLVPRRPTP